jgi:hypothetical protein
MEQQRARMPGAIATTQTNDQPAAQARMRT